MDAVLKWIVCMIASLKRKSVAEGITVWIRAPETIEKAALNMAENDLSGVEERFPLLLSPPSILFCVSLR